MSTTVGLPISLPVNAKSTGFILLSDFVCALLPIFFIRHINRPLREKVVLSVLLAAGLVAAVAGVVKLCLLDRLMDSMDIAWDTAPLGVAAYVSPPRPVASAQLTFAPDA